MITTPLSHPTTEHLTLDRDAFLKLLVTQLQHQDPLEPMDQSGFVAQLAQLQALEEAIELKEGIQHLVGLQEWSHTLGLLGKHVTARHPQTGELIEGIVQAVDLTAGPLGLTVNGLRVRLSDLLTIQP